MCKSSFFVYLKKCFVSSRLRFNFKFELLKLSSKLVQRKPKIYRNGLLQARIYKGCPKNWSPLSLDGLVTPSIGTPTKCPYSTVHYHSNKYSWTSVCQIDRQLWLVLWKQLHVPLWRIRGARSGQKKKNNKNGSIQHLEAFNCKRKTVCFVCDKKIIHD